MCLSSDFVSVSKMSVSLILNLFFWSLNYGLHISNLSWLSFSETLLQNQWMIQGEKEASRQTAERFEETFRNYIGTKMRNLAANVKVLKEIRYVFVSKIVHFVTALFISWKHSFSFPGTFFFFIFLKKAMFYTELGKNPFPRPRLKPKIFVTLGFVLPASDCSSDDLVNFWFFAMAGRSFYSILKENAH